MVQKMGHSAITAADGVEAVELFKCHTDSIVWVILDINMPKMDGISVFRHIRSIRHQTKVIIVSGVLNDEKRVQISPLLPVSCLNKPISFDTLSKLLL